MAEHSASKGLGCERLAVSTAAVGLAHIPVGATWALMRAKTAAICFTDDGATTPTPTVGMELEIGDTLTCTANLSKFQAIRRDAADAVLLVNYYTGA
jgi:hypothetical protein